MKSRNALSGVVVCCSLAITIVGCGSASRLQQRQTAPPVPPTVRVLLKSDADRFVVKGSGRYLVQGTIPDGGVVTYYCKRPVTLTYLNRGWELTEKAGTVLETELIQPSVYSVNDDHHLSINGSPYPGTLVFLPPRGTTENPRIINQVHIDDYLLGVLPPELGQRSADEFEAIKAQAVAARTYALSRLGQYEGKEYDLYADHHDQIYVGLQSTTKLIRRAVKETIGEVLRYDGNLIEAYYHSTCGGFTDDITAVWGKDYVPYLHPASDDTFCRWSKYSVWTEIWDNKTLYTNLQRYLQSRGTAPFKTFTAIRGIRTDGTTPGGRVGKLIIETDRGVIILPSDESRWALGRPSTDGPILQSARFTLYPEYDDYGELMRLTATGNGYGHGIGMCQCGMIGRARAGHDYRHILEHYYTGAIIEKTY